MYAGGHASMLCGVFHGTVGWSDCEGCVEAYRALKTVRRRQCSCGCGRVRSSAAEIRGGGIVWMGYVGAVACMTVSRDQSTR